MLLLLLGQIFHNVDLFCKKKKKKIFIHKKLFGIFHDVTAVIVCIAGHFWHICGNLTELHIHLGNSLLHEGCVSILGSAHSQYTKHKKKA